MNIESQREDLISGISLVNGRVTVMPPKLGQSEVSDSLTGGQRLTVESSPLRISLSWLAQLTLRCKKAFLFFLFYFLPACLF